MTQTSRTTDEILNTSVESDGFIDAVLELAEDTVGSARSRRERSPQDVAVDMIDGEALTQPAGPAAEPVVDLTDGVASAPDTASDPAPVVKAKSRSAATAKAKKQPKAETPVEAKKQPKAKQLKAKSVEAEKPVKAKQPKVKPAEAEKPVKAKQPKAKPAEAEKPVKAKQPKAKPAEAEKPVKVKPVKANLAEAQKPVKAKPPEAEPLEAGRPKAEQPAEATLSQASRAAPSPRPNRAVTPVVDYRGAVAPVTPAKRRARPIRRMRRALREYTIRRSSGIGRIPLRKRWRQARLRKMRERRRAATQAALRGQDPAEINPGTPNIAMYALAVVVVAALVVVALVVLL